MIHDRESFFFFVFHHLDYSTSNFPLGLWNIWLFPTRSSVVHTAPPVGHINERIIVHMHTHPWSSTLASLICILFSKAQGKRVITFSFFVRWTGRNGYVRLFGSILTDIDPQSLILALSLILPVDSLACFRACVPSCSSLIYVNASPYENCNVIWLH